MVGSSHKGMKFLFIPVSSAEGIGEYMRSLIIADAIADRWPQAQIRFILHRDAPYVSACRYPTALLDETPTKRVAAVNQIVSDYRPDVVIFDASGRKTQLQHAKRCGAKVIFISQHRRKRSRGLKWQRLRVTDSHWVVQPKFFIGDISWLERLKLRWLRKPEPITVGPVFSSPQPARQQQLLSQYNLRANNFWLFNAGSGGHQVAGKLVADTFAKAAAGVYQQTGMPCVMVFGANYRQALPQYPGVVAVTDIDNVSFISLLAAAASAVLAGGDTLLQALALHIPTVAVPVAKDQHARINSCAAQHLCLKAEFDTSVMINCAIALREPEMQMQLKQQMSSQGLSNGLDVVMAQLEALLR
ncbi:MAG: hypothetical protein AB7E17_07610 [Shewanella sp.]